MVYGLGDIVDGHLWNLSSLGCLRVLLFGKYRVTDSTLLNADRTCGIWTIQKGFLICYLKNSRKFVGYWPPNFEKQRLIRKKVKNSQLILEKFPHSCQNKVISWLSTWSADLLQFLNDCSVDRGPLGWPLILENSSLAFSANLLQSTISSRLPLSSENSKLKKFLADLKTSLASFIIVLSCAIPWHLFAP